MVYSSDGTPCRLLAFEDNLGAQGLAWGMGPQGEANTQKLLLRQREVTASEHQGLLESQPPCRRMVNAALPWAHITVSLC